MDYPTFRELVISYVKVAGGRCGWSAVDVHVANTGSAYVRLERIGERGQVEKCCVRVSDHRPGKSVSERLFSVRQAAAGRLHQLADFLARGRMPRPAPVSPAGEPQFPDAPPP